MPDKGKFGSIKLSPFISEFTLDKGSLSNFFKSNTQSVIVVEHKSVLTNPKELVNFSGNGIGDKVRDVKDLGSLVILFLWIFMLLGSYSVLSMMTSLSILFHVVKKFKYLSTNYGPYMKHLLIVLESKTEFKTKTYQDSSFWYNYKNSKINSLLSPGPY